MRLPVPAILLLLFLAVIFPVHVKAEPAPDAPGIVEAVCMLRLYNPNSGEHFYTSDEEESRFLIELGWYDEGTGWLAPLHSDTPVYRLYNPNAGDHHYTTSKEERDHLVSVGWNDEGIGWYSAGQRERRSCGSTIRTPGPAPTTLR